jgi:hypothetical protein
VARQLKWYRIRLGGVWWWCKKGGWGISRNHAKKFETEKEARAVVAKHFEFAEVVVGRRNRLCTPEVPRKVRKVLEGECAACSAKTKYRTYCERCLKRKRESRKAREARR